MFSAFLSCYSSGNSQLVEEPGFIQAADCEKSQQVLCKLHKRQVPALDAKQQQSVWFDCESPLVSTPSVNKTLE